MIKILLAIDWHLDQVINLDLGDEVRTVYSLSSRRMKVESLFIDEGFGSLDAATLNIAMDALERLHNQGRKVGVISHVQEMTERIRVQIKVSKLKWQEEGGGCEYVELKTN